MSASSIVPGRSLFNCAWRQTGPRRHERVSVIQLAITLGASLGGLLVDASGCSAKFGDADWRQYQIVTRRRPAIAQVRPAPPLRRRTVLFHFDPAYTGRSLGSARRSSGSPYRARNLEVHGSVGRLSG